MSPAPLAEKITEHDAVRRWRYLQLEKSGDSPSDALILSALNGRPSWCDRDAPERLRGRRRDAHPSVGRRSHTHQENKGRRKPTPLVPCRLLRMRERPARGDAVARCRASASRYS